MDVGGSLHSGERRQGTSIDLPRDGEAVLGGTVPSQRGLGRRRRCGSPVNHTDAVRCQVFFDEKPVRVPGEMGHQGGTQAQSRRPHGNVERASARMDLGCRRPVRVADDVDEGFPDDRQDGVWVTKAAFEGGFRCWHGCFLAVCARSGQEDVLSAGRLRAGHVCRRRRRRRWRVYQRPG